MKIIECKEIMDGKAHAVKFDNGVSATAWNDKIPAGELMSAFSSQAEVEVELKAYTSRAGKTGTNIVAFKILGEDSVEVTNTDGRVGHIEVTKEKTPTPLMSEKTISILAQVMVKAACYGRNDVTIEKAIDMYHEAVLSFEQNG